MREILFRGKSADNGEWLYGMPFKTHIGIFIVYEENPHYCGQYGYMEIDGLGKVDPDTISQYTGLKDKSGKKIFEGDIAQIGHSNKLAYLVFEEYQWIFKMPNLPSWRHRLENNSAKYKIVGNIWDNPELLKEAET